MAEHEPVATRTTLFRPGGPLPFGDEERDPAEVVKRLLDEANKGAGTLGELSGYVFDRELGRGGMGAVFLIRRPSSESKAAHDAALKVMLPEVSESEGLRGKFLREIDVARLFADPHLVTLRHSGAWDCNLWYTMDYCQGGNVSQLVRKRGGTIPADEARKIVLQVLDGLECLHRAKLPAADVDDSLPSEATGVVHRDIKPANILLHGREGSYTAKLGDYGLAKFRALAGRSGWTPSGAREGTWTYMCRQQLDNFKYAGHEVDLWATAACLYFMLTGSCPRDIPKGEVRPWIIIKRDKPVSIRTRASERGIRIPEDIPDTLADLLDKALDDSGRLYFQSALEFRTALEASI